jgi:hypothetical protein
MDELDFYSKPGVMTDLEGFDEALVGMPTDPAGIAVAVQGLVVHLFWAKSYDLDVPTDREHEVRTRSAARMIETILRHDPRPLVERREPGARFLGNCRHFSTFTVALLRRGRSFRPPAGRDLPPRGSCMAALPGRPRGRRPIRHPRHVGQWFIRGNIARDLASLNKVEMLPWDGWGDLASLEPPPGGNAYVDEVAALTVSGDHDAIWARYESDDGLRAPSKVICFDAPTPYEDEVPELA